MWSVQNPQSLRFFKPYGMFIMVQFTKSDLFTSQYEKLALQSNTAVNFNSVAVYIHCIDVYNNQQEIRGHKTEFILHTTIYLSLYDVTPGNIIECMVNLSECVILQDPESEDISDFNGLRSLCLGPSHMLRPVASAYFLIKRQFRKAIL